MKLLTAWGEGRYDLAAPSLWIYETGNILDRLLQEGAPEKMDLLTGLGIQNVECTPEMYKMIFAWMREKKVTFYDAAYLAAAHSLNAVLVTADQSFARKMGDVQGLCLLQNFKL